MKEFKIKMNNLNLIFLISILLIFAACNSKSDKDLFETGMEDLKNQNVQEAIKNLKKLIDEHPQSEFVPEALFILGTLYQGQEADSIHKINFYQKALEYYQKLIENYPNYKKTPEAIFLAGFINAEYLKNYEQARYYYKKFLKTYPDHELAQSVQTEYDNLGKSPEKILKEKGVDIKSQVSSK